MKQLILSILFCLIGYISVAQTLDDLEFGTDTTFEVLTWNIEHFPKNGQATVNYVKQIIQNLDVDLCALQEIEDESIFNSMVSDLAGYNGYFASNSYAPLAYIYKSNTIVINDIYEIYTSYWSPFPRSPLVMDLTFLGEHFIVINNHFKCCGNGYLDMGNDDDEEFRRYEANRLLKEYIEYYFSNDRVIVVGDLNDILTDVESDNVFQLFLDDSNNYKFADMAIAEGSSSNWSYPFSSYYLSHIDHVLITNEMFNESDNAGSACETIIIDDYMSNYESNISDHRPVGLKIKPNLGSGINIESLSSFNLNSYPNPFFGKTTILFDSPEKQSVIEIYNINGQKIYSKQIFKGQKSITWNAE